MYLQMMFWERILKTKDQRLVTADMITFMLHSYSLCVLVFC